MLKAVKSPTREDESMLNVGGWRVEDVECWSEESGGGEYVECWMVEVGGGEYDVGGRGGGGLS